jgi:hypothetical protein
MAIDICKKLHHIGHRIAKTSGNQVYIGIKQKYLWHNSR